MSALLDNERGPFPSNGDPNWRSKCCRMSSRSSLSPDLSLKTSVSEEEESHQEGSKSLKKSLESEETSKTKGEGH